VDNKRRICLFTAHSPLTGGGGVILRSLIQHLPDLSITWYYTGNKAVPGYESGYLGEAIMGGSFVNDVKETYIMLADHKSTKINSLVTKLSAIDCDEYWIVSHNEGLRLAVELSRQQNRPVHMTVHDDWAGALCARSIRYRFLAPQAKKMTIAALKAVTSFDVVSTGMRDYYRRLTGRTGQICHRFLPEDSIKKADPEKLQQGKITVGHIGSIYSRNDFVVFLSTFTEFFKAKGQEPLIKMWGCHLTINDIPAALRSYIFFYPTLPEEEVMPLLSTCDFLYAMYPLTKSLSVFSQTSLPTKLSSYLQVGLPVLGHGPANSSLAEFLNAHNLGTMWCSNDKNDGFKSLERILTIDPTLKQLQATRDAYFGEKNLTAMHKVLSNFKL